MHTPFNRGPAFGESKEFYMLKESGLTSIQHLSDSLKDSAAGGESDSEENFARLKTPLIAIFSMTDLLRQTGMTDEQASLVQTIEESATYLFDEINRIIDKVRGRTAKAEHDQIIEPLETLRDLANKQQLSGESGWYQPAQKSDLKVLVVEDNPVLQLAILKQLCHLGIRAEAVSDGQAAIELARNNTFDLIFMDCQMPMVDAFTATETIRSIHSSQNTRIVALTAGYEETVKEKCLLSGMDDCLIKPARIDDLRAIIERWYRIS